MAWDDNQQWYHDPSFNRFPNPGYHPNVGLLPPPANLPFTTAHSNHPAYPIVVVPPRPHIHYEDFRSYEYLHFDTVGNPLRNIPRQPPGHSPHDSQVSQSSTNVPYADFRSPNSIITRDIPVDYKLLLLSLADQYINEAYATSARIALCQESSEVGKYYKLIATGLACYETVLRKQWKLHPRQEALIQLRYATLLFEDTDNNLETESILTKGVTFCERNRLFGLKYSMQHLLARTLHKTNAAVSAKYLDKTIQEAETCQHTVWTYALRFLRVSLSPSNSGTHESTVALHHLRYISNLSKRNGDIAISNVCSILEAMLHLRISNADSADEAQRALAVVRAQQLNNKPRNCLQIDALLHFLDLSCSLDPHQPILAQSKVQAMQKFLDDTNNRTDWHKDGSFMIPVENSDAGSSLTSDTNGIFAEDGHGKVNLNFSWLPKLDVYALGYLLSAIAFHSKNPSDGHKSEKFLKEALRMIEDGHQSTNIRSIESLPRTCTKANWRRTLQCYIFAHLVIATCERSDWTAARTNYASLQKLICMPNFSVSDSFSCLVTYLDGMIQQGSGTLDAAIRAYESPCLALPEPSARNISSYRLNISILAALNTLFIIRASDYRSHASTQSLLERLDPFINPRVLMQPNQNENPHLRAAHLFLLSTISSNAAGSPSFSVVGIRTFANNSTPPDNGPKILPTKQHLQQSLSLAKSVSNNQILTLALSYMCHAFFQGIVGEQAIQAASAARKTAKESGSKIWVAVSDGMLEASLRVSGREIDAERIRKEWVDVVNEIENERRALDEYA